MAQSILKAPDVAKFDMDFFTECGLRPETVIDNGMCGDIVLASPQETPSVKFIVKKFCLLDKERKRRREKSFKREVKFMQSLDHPYLTKCISAAKCPGYSAISMEYYQRGTLDEYVGQIDLAMSEQCIVQVACALRYMHQNKLVHLDVKLDNIFLDAQYNAVLGDFGLAAEMKPGQQTLPKKNIGGTIGYSAPEYVAASCETQLDPYLLDSYSLGVVLWSLVFEQGPGEDVKYHCEASERHDLLPHIRDMLLGLLHLDPAERVTVADFVHGVPEGVIPKGADVPRLRTTDLPNNHKFFIKMCTGLRTTDLPINYKCLY